MSKFKKKLVTPKQALENAQIPLIYEFKTYTQDGVQDLSFSVFSRSVALQTINDFEKLKILYTLSVRLPGNKFLDFYDSDTFK